MRCGIGILGVAALVASGGCGGRGERTGGGLEERDSAGVHVVHNPRVGLLGERADLEEVRRIGAVSGEEPYLLSQVYDVAVGADGSYFVGNNQTVTVREFTPDGEFVREYGGRGKGPGEFVMVNRVDMVGDDVAITDWQAGGKLGVFSRTGELLEYHALMAADGSRLAVMGHGPHGWIGTTSRPGDYPRETEPGRRYEMDADLRILYPEADSAGPVLFDTPPRVLYGSTTTEGLDWPLFQGGTAAMLDGSGRMYLADTATYRIDIFDADGRHVRSVSRDYDPVPITGADIDALIDKSNARYDTVTTGTPESRRQGRERMIARIRDQATFPMPATMPPLGQLIPAEDGAFWIERIDIAPPADIEFRHYYGYFGSSLDFPIIWDVFDASGRFLAAVEMPARFSPMAVTERTVTGVIKDSLDVEYVVTYRVRERGRER